MTKEGFIFLHRKLIEWEWYSDINVTRVFIHCLLEANHADNNWHGQIIKKGSFVTSYEKLAIATTLTVQQVRTALNKLKSTGEITYKSTSRNSIITINNWDKFQASNKQNNSQITNKQQTNNKQITTNNNDNNENNIIVIGEKTKTKIFQKPTVKEISQYCIERRNTIDANSFFDYYESKGWMIGKNHMKDWKAAIRTWERNHNDFDYARDKEEGPIDYANAPYNPYG